MLDAEEKEEREPMKHKRNIVDFVAVMKVI